MNFTVKENPKCKNCNKTKGDHKAKTFECPEPGRTQYPNFVSNQFFEAKKTKKKVKPTITNVEHIKSVPIPVDEKKKVYNYIYCVGSSSERPERSHRPWAFYDSLEKAIEDGIYGWSDAETFYESGYYDYVVIQRIPLNHPMPSMEMIDFNGHADTTWFKIVRKEADKMKHDIRKAIVRCEKPERFKMTIGFF